VWGTPAIDQGVAIFGDVNGSAYAVNVEDGSQAWRVQLDGSITASPAVENGVVYFPTESGTVFARLAASGDPKWQIPVGGELLSDPILGGDSLYVASLGGTSLVTCLDSASGATRWSFQPAQ
jgi:outer membrane protein assembly factor BamB